MTDSKPSLFAHFQTQKWRFLESRIFIFKKGHIQRDVKNRVSTNGIYNHLKNNKKHKIGWDDAVFIDREPHFMRRKIKESIYINALDPSEKHSKIMNLEKGIATNPCWNEFNSEVRKILRLWKIHADAISWEISMYFHNDCWTFCVFISGEIIVYEDLSKHCTFIVLLKKTSIDVGTLRK